MNLMMLSPYSGLAIDLAIDVLLKATIVIGVAGAATLLLRAASAATRHAVWSIALGCLLLLPLLPAAFPSWHVEPLFVSASIAENGDAVTTAAPGAVTQPAATVTANLARSPSAAQSAPGLPVVAETGSRGPSPAGVVLLLWGLGAVLLLGRLLRNVMRVYRLTGRAAPCHLPGVEALTQNLSFEMQIWRPIRVLLSDEVTGPVTWGTWEPVVILPRTAADWTAERTRIVLVHEFAHVARWDYGQLLMVEIVSALYWFNPLVWFAARMNAVERERACDDQALRGGIRSDVYATHLYEIARDQLADRTPRAAFAMAQPSSLARRFRSILTREMNRAPVSPGRVLATSVAALAIAFPLATVEIWGTTQERQERQERQGPSSVVQRLDELEDPDPLMRRYAAWALGELESERAVRPLIDHLNDDDADVRLVSAWALGEIKDRGTIAPLIELLEDSDPLVREMAALALGEIEHSSAIMPLLDALERDSRLLEPVVWALGEIGGEEARAAREVLFRELDRRNHRNEQVWTGTLGSREARGMRRDVDQLIDALRDRDAELRRSAAEWLGIRGDDRAVEPLLDTLRDPVPAVRAMAVWALDEINPSRH
jgi:beta-lactamase regulating signal transducer with metallopeptidase domain